MAKLTKKDQTARVESMPGFEGRYLETDGYTMGFEKYEEDGDFTPYFRGARTLRGRCAGDSAATPGASRRLSSAHRPVYIGRSRARPGQAIGSAREHA